MSTMEYAMTVGLYAARNGERRQAERRQSTREAPERRTGERRRGRPPRIVGEPSDRRREFRLTHAEDAELVRIAQENGTDVAAMIREAVNEYVSDYAERRPFRT